MCVSLNCPCSDSLYRGVNHCLKHRTLANDVITMFISSGWSSRWLPISQYIPITKNQHGVYHVYQSQTNNMLIRGELGPPITGPNSQPRAAELHTWGSKRSRRDSRGAWKRPTMPGAAYSAWCWNFDHSKDGKLESPWLGVIFIHFYGFDWLESTPFQFSKKNGLQCYIWRLKLCFNVGSYNCLTASGFNTLPQCEWQTMAND